MEHQISLSIRGQDNSRELQSDSRMERDDGDTTDCLPSPNYLPSSFPKEPILARTSKLVSNADTEPASQRPFTFCSPIIHPIVETSPHHHPQSILEHDTGIVQVPAQQLANDPILDAFRLATSPRWSPAPRTKLLFWWGFLCPPLWFYGSLHLIPPLRRRLNRPKNTPKINRRPRRGQIVSYLSRLQGPFSKGDVEVGTTTVVVVPRSKTLFDDSCETVMITDWSPGCISSAERLDAAGINASEWLHPDARTEEALAELDKCERRGAYHCLLAFLLFSIILAVSVIISQKVNWPIHTSTHLTSSENEPIGNTNLLGASSHSSPL
ncbi:hypothetical protein, variant 2 [Puccinia triticina 1-1 BBBD Race 1]|uniref:Uncharacterized protein n=2 Tax=Puccinia triticina TaxID=208348 RepID=A0A180GMG9_PUCT1|nr:uncharacterized protein PtA15_3A570 [Puccinia triticina]OAV93492.1 hypothetical protein PTTG_12510 [Puccinia triticina 1-1 BBBD Race 1]OAV93493.1 hypothetical protein, variant 1 [Puccinia triticina 1-1 BBBD Race 1]OAV93494.1 hypothetical protein, variant 2 [Puccinia triticina 1-1 BBBD Race 1]WAQ83201.1 hypothetical protein PtA15_3A570 [Puccinia triticina]WAR54048.1 hypothetical protein PtB15_3B558 [Puccinia triticina]